MNPESQFAERRKSRVTIESHDFDDQPPNNHVPRWLVIAIGVAALALLAVGLMLDWRDGGLPYSGNLLSEPARLLWAGDPEVIPGIGSWIWLHPAYGASLPPKAAPQSASLADSASLRGQNRRAGLIAPVRLS
jgi:hypothetical protein